MKLTYYSEQQKVHIQERAYLCIWNSDIVIVQEYYNFTALLIWIVYTYISA